MTTWPDDRDIAERDIANRPTLTLTHWERDRKDQRGRIDPIRFATRERAEAATMNALGEPYVGEAREVKREFFVGQTVKVHAFGRLRPGTVAKLGRSRVTVDYVRNQSGERHERAFTAGEIYD